MAQLTLLIFALSQLLCYSFAALLLLFTISVCGYYF